jgi:hypothetical protein
VLAVILDLIEEPAWELRCITSTIDLTALHCCGLIGMFNAIVVSCLFS